MLSQISLCFFLTFQIFLVLYQTFYLKSVIKHISMNENQASFTFFKLGDISTDPLNFLKISMPLIWLSNNLSNRSLKLSSIPFSEDNLLKTLSLIFSVLTIMKQLSLNNI